MFFGKINIAAGNINSRIQYIDIQNVGCRIQYQRNGVRVGIFVETQMNHFIGVCRFDNLPVNNFNRQHLVGNLLSIGDGIAAHDFDRGAEYDGQKQGQQSGKFNAQALAAGNIIDDFFHKDFSSFICSLFNIYRYLQNNQIFLPAKFLCLADCKISIGA